jgi:hypothetical protein
MAIIKTFFTQPEISPKDIFIIGAGTFGKKALERLSAKYPTSHITIVDRSEEALSNLPRNKGASFRTIKGDGVETIVQNEKIIQPDTWVIPAIPVHVASEWIVRKLRHKGYNLNPAPIPEDLQTKLPNPFTIEGRNDLLFVSIASFICPDNCPEPPEKCTHTGKPRPGNLYEMIANAVPEPWSALVFRSFQLAPGVGGYPASYLMEGLKTLEELVSFLGAECRGIPFSAECQGIPSSLVMPSECEACPPGDPSLRSGRQAEDPSLTLGVTALSVIPRHEVPRNPQGDPSMTFGVTRNGSVGLNIQHPLIIATACRCHGVVSAFKLHLS